MLIISRGFDNNSSSDSDDEDMESDDGESDDIDDMESYVTDGEDDVEMHDRYSGEEVSGHAQRKLVLIL